MIDNTNIRKYTLRDYQQNACDEAVRFFQEKGLKYNALLVLSTGAGKSLCIAEIASRLDDNLIIFCPSKEILQQNCEKLDSYGVEYGVWSASVGKKERKRITFAMIGSVKNYMADFDEYQYVIIDEAHTVSSTGGMYYDFINATKRKVLGLTATPYRLTSVMGIATLKFLTRTRPRVFSKVLYCMQTSEMVEKGYLAKLRYFDMQVFDAKKVMLNTTGLDYNEHSLHNAYIEQDMNTKVLNIVWRLLHPKNGIPRKGVLVFTRFVDESEHLVRELGRYGVKSACVSAETPKKERERILDGLKRGEISVVSNVNTIATGFDYPALDTIVLARPTMSLAIYTQQVGRALRPYDGKDGWVVDLCGNYKKFGRTDDLWIGYTDESKGWAVYGVVDGKRKILTGVQMGDGYKQVGEQGKGMLNVGEYVGEALAHDKWEDRYSWMDKSKIGY